MSDAINKVSEFWGDEKKETKSHHWLAHPVCRAFINERVSGDASVATSEHWRHTHFDNRPVPLALSLGCGFGDFDRYALNSRLVERIEGVDISEAAIAQASKYAADEGLLDRVSYSNLDLNVQGLGCSKYDVIFGISSIHHVDNLEALFLECKNALKPGGLFVMDEYIGPSRFQASDKTLRLINDLLANLPDKYKANSLNSGLIKDHHSNWPLTFFDETDPSEAIRSGDILAVLSQHFEVVEYRPYGGALLHMLLSGTAGNFDPFNDADVALLRTMALMEQALEEAGEIPSDFASIVARPKA